MSAIRVVLAIGLLILSGCSTLGLPPAPAPVPPPGGGAPAPAERAPVPQTTGATTSLLTAGRAARESGDLDVATAYIERALRIAPNDAVLWIELGEIKLAEGDAAQAEAMGRKALTLTRGDRALEQAARRLLSDAS
jgi:tetratricopeptide (TPR) repeat protein